MTERWLDESRYQGAPDERAVKASGVAGVVWNDLDPSYAQRCREVSAAGMKVGTYHYLGAGEDPAWAAGQMVQRANATGVPMTILALDIEEGQGDQSARALAFLRTVEQQTSQVPWCYTGGWFIPGRLTDPALAKYPLWDASYQGTEPPPPPPWAAISAWQYTSSGSVPGVAAGAVDMNYVYHFPGGSSPQSGDTLNLAQKRALCWPMRIITAGSWPEDQPTLDYYANQVADDGNNIEDVYSQMLNDARKGGRTPLFEHPASSTSNAPSSTTVASHTHPLSGTTGASQ